MLIERCEEREHCCYEQYDDHRVLHLIEESEDIAPLLGFDKLVRSVLFKPRRGFCRSETFFCRARLSQNGRNSLKIRSVVFFHY